MRTLIHLFDIHQYYLNPYAISPFIAGIMACICAGFLRPIQSSRTWVVFLSAAVWLTSEALMLMAVPVSLSLVWARVFFVGIILTALSIYRASVDFVGRQRQQRIIILVVNAITASMIVLVSCPFFFDSMQETWFGVYPSAGPFIHVIIFYLMLCFALSMTNLVAYHGASRQVIKRQFARFVMLALIGMQGAYVDVMFTYDPAFFPLGYVVLIGFLLVVNFMYIRNAYALLDEHASKSRQELTAKERELEAVVSELRATQVKFWERSKASAFASLSAGILHKISQPITAIHGFVRFLKKEMPADDRFYQPICLIEEQSVALKNMLQDINTLIHHRDDKPGNVAVGEVVRKTMHLLADECKARRIHIEIDIPDTLPYVYFDAIHLQQVVMTLVLNAMEALNGLPQQVTRQITVRASTDAGLKNVTLRFEDTGTGISEEDQFHLFEPFFSTKEKGTGIGLALCRDLLNEHGGNIAFDSGASTGAAFVVTVPCSEQQWNT